MSDVSISYKGAEIASLDDSGTKRLLTSGKYCEDDIEVAYTKPSGGGGDQTISFLDWVQQGSNNGGWFQPSTTRIACKHMLFKCKSISIPSGVQLALGVASMPTINNTVAAGSGFEGFWNGTAYTTSFTWFNAPTFDLTQILDWSDNYVVMFLRHQDNSTIQPSEGNSVVVTYDLADGAFVR